MSEGDKLRPLMFLDTVVFIVAVSVCAVVIKIRKGGFFVYEDQNGAENVCECRVNVVSMFTGAITCVALHFVARLVLGGKKRTIQRDV